MKKKIKKSVLLILPIALGVFLIWFSLSKLSTSDKDSIINSFKTANYWWVGLSLLFGILSHLSRAYRWHFMLEPMGYKPKYANSIMTVLIGYLLNLFIPRSGEVARAAGLKKYEQVPFEKAFGTIVAERVSDVVMLIGIIALAFFLQTELISSYLFKDDGESSIITKIVFFVVLPIVGIFTYRYFKKSTNPYIAKVVTFIKGLLEGVASILTMKKKWKFMFHTLFIWVMYVLMMYAVTFALPETTNLPFGAIIVSFVLGSLSMALTNGGLGSYPIFVASALVLYNIDNNAALAFGWIMWTAQTIMVILFGCISLVLLPIYNKYNVK